MMAMKNQIKGLKCNYENDHNIITKYVHPQLLLRNTIQLTGTVREKLNFIFYYFLYVVILGIQALLLSLALIVI